MSLFEKVKIGEVDEDTRTNVFRVSGKADVKDGDYTTVNTYLEPTDRNICILSVLNSWKGDFRRVEGLVLNEEWQKDEWGSAHERIWKFPYIEEWDYILHGVDIAQTTSFSGIVTHSVYVEVTWIDEKGKEHEVRVPKIDELGLTWDEIKDIIEKEE